MLNTQNEYHESRTPSNLHLVEMEGSSDPPSNVSLKLLQRKDETVLLLRLNNIHYEHPAFDLDPFEEAEIIL